MTKRIIVSLAMIAFVIAGVTSATVAYFSHSVNVAGNTFATGTVTIGPSEGLPLSVTNIGPGLSQTKDVNLQYIGSLNADIYVGVGGASIPGQAAYIADHLWLNIYDKTTGQTWLNNWTSYASTNWVKIAENVNQNDWKSYRLTFTMDSSVGNDHMGVSNTDTVLKLYAVQTGGPVPPTPPYLTTP